MKNIIAGLFMLFLSGSDCYATATDDELKGISWISVKEESQQPNQWLCFRKQIFIDNDIPENVYMDIAVDSKYWLWINNELVVFEGGLKRGPNPDDTYYDTVDISDYLVEGDNIISILMWYWGRDGYCHKSSGKSGLLAKISINDNNVIHTDSSWKVRIHPAFGETGNPKPNYRLPESNVSFDARKSLGNWKEYDYDDSKWEAASELGEYPCSPWNKLYKRPFPNWKDSGIIKYQNLTTEKKDDTTLVIGVLPKNITVTPYIKVKAVAGKTIDIRSDNYKGGSEYNVRAEYVTRSGVQEFEIPNYINGHKIFYTIPEGVKLLKAGYRETRFNTEILGSFRCSDDFYNKLWEKSLNTMNLNMRDAIQDPDRERSQWWGDAAIISNEIYYSCDTNGLSAVRKAILNLVDWQKEDGTLYSPVPSGSWDGELPLQMLASVGKFGFWNYYKYTADLNTIRYIYPKIKKYLSLWNIDENGIVKHRTGGWDWADWGDNIDVEILDNAWYCLALEAAINMGTLLDDKQFVDYYTSQLNLVRNASQKFFWKGNYFRSDDYKGLTDDRANGLAILAGFTTKEMEEKTVKFLTADRMGASPYMEKYILEALLSGGYVQEGLDRMKQRYTNMVTSPLTTLWEDWAIGGAGGGSINHGWAGGALSLLPQYVGGIYPYEAGWETIMIKPQLGDLEWVECDVPIKNSVLNVKVKNDKKKGKYEIEVFNSSKNTCIVAFPKDKIKDSELILNGKVLSSSEIQNIKEMNGEKILANTLVYKTDEKYLYFKTSDTEIRISNM
ncbi:MAG: alpha-L-rhamnosidase N-terminal domain-containing protein [Phocaeicola sp.]|nr:alpha-L-rhamnosidase N-terminal domain-containing protein [Phocaeicola sp.]